MFHDIVMKDTMMSYKKQGLFILREDVCSLRVFLVGSVLLIYLVFCVLFLLCLSSLCFLCCLCLCIVIVDYLSVFVTFV